MSHAGSLSSSGSEFQTVGPAAGKARRPYVLNRQRGTISRCRLAERSRCRDATSMTGLIWSARYRGACPCKQQHAACHCSIKRLLNVSASTANTDSCDCFANYITNMNYNIRLTVVSINCKNCPIGCPYNLFLRFPRTPASWCRVFRSRVFHPCDLVPGFPVPCFPPLYFWRCRVFRSRVFSRPCPRSYHAIYNLASCFTENMHTARQYKLLSPE